ncbi:hypothetical protein ACIQFU_38245 [Streptomyces sp. NPDC093065]
MADIAGVEVRIGFAAWTAVAVAVVKAVIQPERKRSDTATREDDRHG